ncbi:MAG: hypothetical protein BAJATHORv1_20262 [Candidatus Thorarchaeota archaeon]|nr:MAG: hypothetical protein BAJATHORv1_20262 [Candidatus Thorarchaeota archaeon]
MRIFTTQTHLRMYKRILDLEALEIKKSATPISLKFEENSYVRRFAFHVYSRHHDGQSGNNTTRCNSIQCS